MFKKNQKIAVVAIVIFMIVGILIAVLWLKNANNDINSMQATDEIKVSAESGDLNE